jgi:signal transduction histidine kinase
MKQIFILFLFTLSITGGYSQVARDSVSSSDKNEQLKNYYDQANELYNAFKNGPAFEQLQNYSNLKEKIFIEQKVAELDRMEDEFNKTYNLKQKELAQINNDIASLKAENDSLAEEKHKLIRNTVLFFVFLISTMVLFLFFQQRQSRISKYLGERSDLQLKRSHETILRSESLIKLQPELLKNFKVMQEDAAKSIAVIEDVKNSFLKEEIESIRLHQAEQEVKRMSNGIDEAVNILATSEQFNAAHEERKAMTNLNNIINEVFELSYAWMQSTDKSFESLKVKDLEKILPEILIMPNAIRTALFHFFNNAFYAVNQKKKSDAKGFEPKVTVSTRKLPRFVQIRIKDNGTGIETDTEASIYQPFFSTKDTDDAVGLGLAEAQTIIKKMHGGEIIIETDVKTGTDFLVRFPINTPM